MKNEQLIRKSETASAILPRKPSQFLRSARAHQRRTIRIALPWMPWRKQCLAEQKIRAARYAAELAEWQATGGDFLRSGPARPHLTLNKCWEPV
jgi:hypothetical protein